MNASQRLLLDAAEYVRVHGFSVYFERDGCPRCFVGAMRSVSRSGEIPLRSLVRVTSGCDFSSSTLEREGWTAADAIAALEMAADLAADKVET